MEAIIFCGIQASGKTTFYQENFLKTHIRISLDMLRTRNKEGHFLHTCFITGQAFVVDNTNPTKVSRKKYIDKAKAYKFSVIGYFFESIVHDAIERNKNRTHKENIPIAGIRGTFKKLEVPDYEEGFDQLYTVTIINNTFQITPKERISD